MKAIYPSLQDKVVLVTGGTKGIGGATSELLLSNNAKVVATYLQDDACATAFSSRHDKAELVVVKSDIADLSQHEHLLKQVDSQWGQPVDLLVNNAGVLVQKPFQDITEADWDWTLETNLKGAFFLAQCCLKRPTLSRIVNIASIGGQVGGDKAPHYAASKAAMISVTRSLARIAQAQNCLVNAISPGWIETPIFDPDQVANLRELAKTQVLLGRMGAPEEVAAAILFLLSDDASFITGQCLNVNGGMYFG